MLIHEKKPCLATLNDNLSLFAFFLEYMFDIQNYVFATFRYLWSNMSNYVHTNMCVYVKCNLYICINTNIYIYIDIYSSQSDLMKSLYFRCAFFFPDTAKESSFHLLSSGLPWVSQTDYVHSYRPGLLLDQATWSPQAGTCSTGITRSLVAQVGWCLVTPDNPDNSCVLACEAGTLNLCGRLHRRSAIRVGWVGLKQSGCYFGSSP